MKTTIQNIYAEIRKLNYVLKKQQKRETVKLLFAMLIGSVFEMLGIAILIPLITSFFYSDRVADSVFLESVIAFLHFDESLILNVFMFASIVLFLIKNTYLIWLSYYKNKYMFDIHCELSARMMNMVMNKDYLFFLQHNTGYMQQVVVGDVARTYSLLTNVTKMAMEAITILAILLFLLFSDARMGIFLVLLTGGSALFAIKLFRGRAKRIGIERVELERSLNQEAFESFSGFKEILVMQRQFFFADKYKTGWKQMKKSIVSERVYSEIPAFILEGICISGVLLYVYARITIGNFDVGFISYITAFFAALIRVLPGMARISSAVNATSYYLPGLDGTYDFLIQQGWSEKHKAENREENSGEFSFLDRIEICDVAWKYPNSKDYVFNNLNMVIKKGESIGIIGKSGAGKSTLTDILMGLITPYSGSIMIDGENIAEDMTGWRNLIGYVPQSIYLIDDNIIRNVAFGIADELIDEKKVWDSLDKAQLSDFVRSLPNGLYTSIGERGVRFSGGQRQRLAIARALYSDPQLLILDEATAALDGETEQAVMDAIENLQGTITMVIVAHRLTTIEKCDHVYEIVSGSIIKQK